MTDLTAKKSDYILTTTYSSEATKNKGVRKPSWRPPTTLEVVGADVPRQSGYLLRVEQDDLVDTISTSLQNSSVNLYSGSTIKTGQSFSGLDGELSVAKFYLKKTGSPTGNATVKLYEHSGTFGTSSVPTGTALATSDTLDVSTLTTSYADTSFTFPEGQNYRLSSGIDYCIVIEYSGGDSSNYLNVGSDNTPTDAGNAFSYTSIWAIDLTQDVIYSVYASGSLGARILSNTGELIISASTR